MHHDSRSADASLEGTSILVFILVFVCDDYEDLELWYPKLRLEEAGAHVTVAGGMQGCVYSGKHGYPCAIDAAISDMEAPDFHGVVIPGGWMLDKLRRDPHVLRLVQEFSGTGELVAAICHGGWIPISAGVYRGVRVTGSPGIKDDLVNAGAIREDAPVMVDRHHVTSRKPADLPHYEIEPVFRSPIASRASSSALKTV